MNPYREDASGRFSYDRWRAAVDAQAAASGHGLVHAVNSSTAGGHYIINEPPIGTWQNVKWGGASLVSIAEAERSIAALQRRERIRARRRAHLRRLIPWIPLALALLAWTAVAHAQTPAPDTVRIGPTTAVIYIVDLKAPPAYARWYHEAERCVSAIAPAGPWYAPHRTLRGRYAAVRWFVTNQPWRDGLHGGMSTLAAWQPGHRITISAPYLLDSAIVAHEAIHDILAWNHMNDENDPHPMPFYDGRCSKAAYP